MLTPDDVVLILRLHHAGKTVAQIYGETGFAKKTILKYIRQEGTIGENSLPVLAVETLDDEPTFTNPDEKSASAQQ